MMTEKKWLAVFLCVVCLLSACACGGASEYAETEAQSSAVTEFATELETALETELETALATEPETEPETAPETDPETELATEPETEPETAPETDPETELATESETLSLEEQNLAYLAAVSYHDYALTGENTPYFMGRWFEKEVDGISHMVTLTDGSALYFMIHGATSFDVNFTVITTTEEPYFAYSIDGAEPVRQHITQPTVTLPDAERHTVRIIADGMTEGEGKWNEEKGFALRSIIPAEGGTLYGIKPTNKVIFYYGDSITEGIRALNMNATSDGNSATHAYPWYCSRELGAVTYSIGYGASGVTATGSFNTFQNAIEYNSNDRRVEDGIKPDVIVINHGTNDAYSGQFQRNLGRAVELLKTTYPDVPIVYMIPFLQHEGKSNMIAKVMSDHGGYVVQTSDWNLTYTDGVHPDAAGAETAGKKLAAALRDILGEDFFS